MTGPTLYLASAYTEVKHALRKAKSKACGGRVVAVVVVCSKYNDHPLQERHDYKPSAERPQRRTALLTALAWLSYIWKLASRRDQEGDTGTQRDKTMHTCAWTTCLRMSFYLIFKPQVIREVVGVNPGHTRRNASEVQAPPHDNHRARTPCNPSGPTTPGITARSRASATRRRPGPTSERARAKLGLAIGSAGHEQAAATTIQSDRNKRQEPQEKADANLRTKVTSNVSQGPPKRGASERRYKSVPEGPKRGSQPPHDESESKDSEEELEEASTS